MTDKLKTWQEVVRAVQESSQARGMLEIGELWNAIEEMADKIQELSDIVGEGEKDLILGRSVRKMSSGMRIIHFRRNAGDLNWFIANEFGTVCSAATIDEAMAKLEER